MASLSVSLLGSFQASLGGAPLTQFRTKKVQALLIYLITESDTAHQREALMTLLWPGLPDKSARTNLRQILYQLRKAIPELDAASGKSSAPFLMSEGTVVQINPNAAIDLDVATFSRLIRETQSHPHANLLTCPECKTRLEQAIKIYQGVFLADFFLDDSNLFEDWSQARREFYQQQALETLDILISIQMKQGSYAQAEVYTRRLLEVDGLYEPAHRQLMRLYVYAKQRATALRHYERYFKMIEKELGVGPEEETTKLYEAIKANRLIPSDDQPSNLQEETPRNMQSLTPYTDTIEMSLPPFLDGNLEPDLDASPFVAREAELELLRSNLESAKEGQGRILFVVGGAGRGKSTLMREFARRAQEEDEELVIVSGYCHAITGIGDPYLPFREALNMLTGDVEAGYAGGLISREQAIQLWKLMPVTLPALVKLAPDLVDNLVPAQALLERGRLWAPEDSDWFQQLATLPADLHRSGLDQKQIFTQYTAILKTIAKKQPLLLLIEDLHWVDPASSGLLFHLSREISNSRILLVGTYRPEDVGLNRATLTSLGSPQRHPMAEVTNELKRQYGDIWLDLDYLASKERRRFIDNYLDTQPNKLGESFREALFQRTEGHPLFTVELLRTMQECGDLKQDDTGHWTEGEAINWSAMPVKVEGTIENRIERLSKDLQTILTIASIEGEMFTAEVVARVHGLAVHQLISQLSRELDKQHRLISAHASEWLDPGGPRLSIYRFRHQLFQHYVYTRLDDAERRYLHETVGNTIEQLYEGWTETIATQLAWHFEEAGFLAKAIDYLRQSGESAAAVSAHAEAAAHFTRAIDLTSKAGLKTEDQAHLYTRLGQMLLVTKGDGASEVGQAYSRAYELYKEAGESSQLFSALRGLSMHYKFLGESEKALKSTEQLVLLAQRLQDPVFIMESAFAMGSLLYYAGEHVLAQEYLKRGLNSYNPAQHQYLDLFEDQDPGVAILSYITANLWILGYPDQAKEKCAETLALAKELSHPYSLAMAHIWIGWTSLWRREMDTALEHSQAAVALSEEHSFPLFVGVGNLIIGRASAERGKFETAIPLMQEAIELIGKTMSSEVAGSLHLGLLVDALAKSGQTDEGLVIVNQAITQSDSHQYHLMDSELYRLRGELFLLSGQSENQAETNFKKAIEICRQQGARSPELKAVMSLARFWKGQGKHKEARKILGDLFGWFTEGLDTPDLREARALLEESP